MIAIPTKRIFHSGELEAFSGLIVGDRVGAIAVEVRGVVVVAVARWVVAVGIEGEGDVDAEEEVMMGGAVDGTVNAGGNRMSLNPSVFVGTTSGTVTVITTASVTV